MGKTGVFLCKNNKKKIFLGVKNKKYKKDENAGRSVPEKDLETLENTGFCPLKNLKKS